MYISWVHQKVLYIYTEVSFIQSVQYAFVTVQLYTVYRYMCSTVYRYMCTYMYIHRACSTASRVHFNIVCKQVSNTCVLVGPCVLTVLSACGFLKGLSYQQSLVQISNSPMHVHDKSTICSSMYMCIYVTL